MAKLICGFPGVGKSYLTKNVANICDSDYSHWNKNNEWPKNYINYLKENIDKGFITLASSHKEVIAAVKDSGIDYVVVYPNINLKELYMMNYAERGSSEHFIDIMDLNWEKFIKDIKNAVPPEKLIELQCGNYLADVIDLITNNECK